MMSHKGARSTSSMVPNNVTRAEPNALRTELELLHDNDWITESGVIDMIEDYVMGGLDEIVYREFDFHISYFNIKLRAKFTDLGFVIKSMAYHNFNLNFNLIDFSDLRSQSLEVSWDRCGSRQRIHIGHTWVGLLAWNPSAPGRVPVSGLDDSTAMPREIVLGPFESDKRSLLWFE